MNVQEETINAIRHDVKYTAEQVRRLERMAQLTLKLLLAIGKVEWDQRLSLEEYRELEHMVLIDRK